MDWPEGTIWAFDGVKGRKALRAANEWSMLYRLADDVERNRCIDVLAAFCGRETGDDLHPCYAQSVFVRAVCMLGFSAGDAGRVMSMMRAIESGVDYVRAARWLIHLADCIEHLVYPTTSQEDSHES